MVAGQLCDRSGQFGVQRWSITAWDDCCARKLTYRMMIGNLANLLAVTMWVTVESVLFFLLRVMRRMVSIVFFVWKFELR